MTEITSEQHEEATVSFGTYCSVCACTRVCDTGRCCVKVASPATITGENGCMG